MRRTVHSISAAAPALKSVLWPTCFPRPSPTTEPFVSSSVCSGTVSGNRLRPNPHCSDNAACAAFCSQVVSVGDDCDSFGKPSSAGRRPAILTPIRIPQAPSQLVEHSVCQAQGIAMIVARSMPVGACLPAEPRHLQDILSSMQAQAIPPFAFPSPTMARSTFGPRDTLARVGGHHHRCQVPARRGWYTSTPKMHMSISCQVDVL